MGKKRSSPETLLHYRRFTVEAGRRAEWQSLEDQWSADYHPETATHKQAVLRAAEADWLLRLEEERFDKAEFALVQEHGDPLHWNPEQHKHLQWLERRLDRAQRTLLRYQRTAEQTRRTRFTETLRLEAHGWRREAHQWAMKVKQSAADRPEAEAEPEPPPPPPHKPAPYQQWMEAYVEDGVTLTGWNPRHVGMQALLKKMGQPDHLVERALKLPNPLPPEYDWSRTPDGQPVFFQRWITTVEEFVKDMERDLADGNGHATPSPHMPIFKKEEGEIL